MVRGSFLVRFTAAIFLFFSAAVEVGGVLSITRSGCGTYKLCVETPAYCDPSSSSSSCLFASFVATPTNLNFSLRGESSGYVALGLTNSSKDEGVSSLFVCAKNGSSVFIRTVQRNNSAPDAPFTELQMPVSDFAGEVDASVIGCTFSVPLVNISSLKTNQDTVFTVLLGSGNVSGSSLGSFNISLRTKPQDLVNFVNVTATTTVAPTSTAAPTQNDPTPLSITRSGCGTSKLCVETPESCDPSSSSSSCLFASVVATPTNLNFSLRGESSGYVALGLTRTSSMEVSSFYVCGNRSGSFFFVTHQRNNLQNATLTKNTMPVDVFKGELNGTVVKCTFTIQRVNLRSTKSSDAVFAVTLGTGSVNGADLDFLTEVLKTAALDLSDPKANLPGRAVCPSALLSALILPILVTVTVMA